jgi:hypothetical protein
MATTKLVVRKHFAAIRGSDPSCQTAGANRDAKFQGSLVPNFRTRRKISQNQTNVAGAA